MSRYSYLDNTGFSPQQSPGCDLCDNLGAFVPDRVDALSEREKDFFSKCNSSAWSSAERQEEFEKVRKVAKFVAVKHIF